MIPKRHLTFLKQSSWRIYGDFAHFLVSFIFKKRYNFDFENKKNLIVIPRDAKRCNNNNEQFVKVLEWKHWVTFLLQNGGRPKDSNLKCMQSSCPVSKFFSLKIIWLKVK